jgi:hypothetical protein
MGFTSKKDLLAFIEELMGDWGSEELADEVVRKRSLDWTTEDRETLSDKLGPIELIIEK